MLIKHKNKEYDIPYDELKKYEVKKVVNWRADKDKLYWFVSYGGEIFSITDMRDEDDYYHYIIGNYFKTKKEAEKKRDYDFALGTVNRRINELNNGWKPDWNNDSEIKLLLIHDVMDEDIEISMHTFHKILSEINYMKSDKIANQILEEHEKELKIIFGV